MNRVDWRCLGGVVALLQATTLLAADKPEEEPGFELTLAAREVYDDNLYRLPETGDTLAGVARDDRIHRLSAAIDQRWQWSRQQVHVNLQASDSRYERNEQLDHTAGHGRAEWEWEAGSAWSGAIGGDYGRTLANFANTRFIGKDLVETTGAFANLAFRLGPRWSLRTAARRAETEHSAEVRGFDNSTTESASAGLRYRTAAESEIGVSVRGTRARFDSPLILSGQSFDRDYEDESINLEFERVVSPRTRIEASVGLLRRDYDDVSLTDAGKGSFEGPVGDLLLEWQASNKIVIELHAWRRLRAYLDAESDYFVSETIQLAPTWTPTHKIEVSLELGYETQEYLSGSLLAVEGRNDDVRSGELVLSYKPLRKLRFDLTGRLERRDSNRALLGYDSAVAAVGVRWSY